jgi:hypothetical protein
MNRALPLLAVAGALLFLSRRSTAQGSSYIEKLLDGICRVESSCSPYWAHRYHPDGVSYGLYGLTKGAVRSVGMDWEAVKRSTSLQREAARRYLLKMYSLFHDWDLAIQAYHLGPGNVKRGRRDYNYLRKVKSYAGV